MVTVPCANVRKGGEFCYCCAYCKTRLYGSEWWLGGEYRSAIDPEVEMDILKQLNAAERKRQFDELESTLGFSVRLGGMMPMKPEAKKRKGKR